MLIEGDPALLRHGQAPPPRRRVGSRDARRVSLRLLWLRDRRAECVAPLSDVRRLGLGAGRLQPVRPRRRPPRGLAARPDYTSGMAEPATRPPAGDDAPPVSTPSRSTAPTSSRRRAAALASSGAAPSGAPGCASGSSSWSSSSSAACSSSRSGSRSSGSSGSDVIAAKAARPDLAGALGLLAGASGAVVRGEPLQPTLHAIVEAAALGAGADVAVCWLRDGTGDPVARAVWARSAALAAELEGLRLAPGNDRVAAVRDRVDPGATTLSVPLDPARHDGESLELVRRGESLDAEAEHVASLAADLVSLATELCADPHSPRAVTPVLDVAGDALAAASEGERTGARLARVAALAGGAQAALLWRESATGGLTAAGRHGDLEPDAAVEGAAAAALSEREGVSTHSSADGTLVTLQLGQPPVGVLQLLYAPGRPPADLGALASFAVRAAHALRAADRAAGLGLELERSRALLAVVGEAISRLSLEHTLETAIERVAALLGTDRVALYLAEDGVLSAAASRSLDGPHEPVARRLLELALGALGSRTLLEADEVEAADALGPVQPRGFRGRDRVVPGAAARGRERSDRAARGLPGDPATPDRERVGPPHGPRRPARGRGPERPAARAGQGARERARGVARVRARGGEEAGGALRDLALIRPEPVAGDDPRRPRRVDRDAARGRRRRDPHARRPRDGVRRPRPARQRLAGRRRRPRAALPAAAAPPKSDQGLRRAPGGAAPRRRQRRGARRVAGAARALPREGLERRGDPDRHRRRAARDPDARLAPPRAVRSRARSPTPRSRSPARPRSPSTTRACTPSRRPSRTRCSARSSPTRRRTCRGSRSGTSTSRPRGSRSAATSTTISSSPTDGWRSCSATSPGTGSRRPRTWRWRSSSSARSPESTSIRVSSWPPRTRSSPPRSRPGSSSPCSSS